jgi:hypothetical protein
MIESLQTPSNIAQTPTWQSDAALAEAEPRVEAIENLVRMYEMPLPKNV